MKFEMNLFTHKSDSVLLLRSKATIIPNLFHKCIKNVENDFL